MANILIPEDALVVLVGGAGSGKSSFARKHFNESQIVSSDACRIMIADTAEDMSVNAKAFRLAHLITQFRLSLGRLTVFDATNVKPSSRKQLLDLAEEWDRPVVALLIQQDLERSHRWNKSRDRVVPDFVVNKHYDQFIQTERVIDSEGFSEIIRVDPTEEYNFSQPIEIHMASGWDVISDIHGCAEELLELVVKLGYGDPKRGPGPVFGANGIKHPEGRRLAFVGDFTDRGPQNVAVLRFIMNAVKYGDAVAVEGNHDNKLKRTLNGNPTKQAHGLQGTMREIEEKCDPGEIEEFRDFLYSLPYKVKLGIHVVEEKDPWIQTMPEPDLYVVHAGLRFKDRDIQSGGVESFCLYGEKKGWKEENGVTIPVRSYNWVQDWEGPEGPWVVFGHDVFDEPNIRGRTIGIDCGAVFGGKLTALRWPEMEFMQVEAKKVYCER